MKALSIRQPYAFAIVAGYKPVENRTWPALFRGPLLIHAGKQELAGDVQSVIRQVARQAGSTFGTILERYHAQAAFGAIVGRARLIDCVRWSGDPWFYGPYGFVFADAERLEAVPCRGAFGFFDVPATVAARFAARLI